MSMYASLGTLGMLQVELEKVQLKREQLVLALKLFDLPVTPFPMLVEVCIIFLFLINPSV